MSLKQAAGHSKILGNNDLDISQMFLMPKNNESRHLLESTRPLMYNRFYYGEFYCGGFAGFSSVLRMFHFECNIKCSEIEVDVNSQALSRYVITSRLSSIESFSDRAGESANADSTIGSLYTYQEKSVVYDSCNCSVFYAFILPDGVDLCFGSEIVYNGVLSGALSS